MADSCGLDDRSELVETILWWQERCWRGIEMQADAGRPAMIRLRESGGAAHVRDEYRWTADHRETLEAAL